MQAIILAAGQGKRLQPLTNTTPKPLLKVGRLTILEHVLCSLPKEIDEIIIVVSYLSEQIENFIGDSFKNKSIRYIKQRDYFGTGHALQICKKFIKGKFLVLMGDNIYDKKDVKKCLKCDRCMLVYEHKGLFTGNNIVSDQNHNLSSFVETENKVGNFFINTGLYVLDKNFFNYDLIKVKDEYSLPHTILGMTKDYPVRVEKTKNWIQINNHQDLKSVKNKKLI